MSDFCFPLKYKLKNYEWGKKGDESLVARLALQSKNIEEIKCDVAYAELWMGCHDNGQSEVEFENKAVNLSLFLKEQYKTINYLFKILSIQAVLSIQLHPDKKSAEKLNIKYKDIYTDPYPKPEMTIALSNFKAMCGFRDYTQIMNFINILEPLKSLIPSCMTSKFNDDNINKNELITDIYLYLIENTETNTTISKTVKFIKENQNLFTEEYDIFIKLATLYPNDLACFSIFFLNYLELKPFEAIYIPANVPHAYIEGDCAECMISSDNVVRLGLTPKFIDIGTAKKLIRKTPHLLDYYVVPFERTIDENTKIFYYDPPENSGFKVKYINMQQNEATDINENIRELSILINLSSSSCDLSFRKRNDIESQNITIGMGVAIFISCNSVLEKIYNKELSTKLLIAYQQEAY